MDWNALGAIGDLVGGIGVVVTLAYLVGQIRQNTQAIRASSAFDAHLSYVAVNDYLHQSPELNVLMARSADPSQTLAAFTLEEQIRIGAFLRALFHRTEAHYQLYLSGFLDEDFWQRQRSWLRGTLDLPVWRTRWEAEKTEGTFAQRFVDHIESGTPVRVQNLGGGLYAQRGSSSSSDRI